MSELEPGTLVVVKNGATIRRHGSEEEQWVNRPELAMVVQKSHQWHEGVGNDAVEATYLVLFSKDNRMYYVAAGNLAHPDHAHDAGRLFGRIVG